MDLSPVAMEPTLVELPFGLTWGDVQGCFPADWDPLTGIEPRLFETHRTVGVRGEGRSVVALVEHTADGRLASLPVFIKSGADGEAARHRALALAGVPTPRLLASKDDTMVLEQLIRVGIDTESIAEGDELLRALAALNTIAPADGIDTGPYDGFVNEFDRTVEAALRAVDDDQVDALFSSYLRAQAFCQGLPRAMTHGEMGLQQVGWADRNGRDELVLFDWATSGLRPRLSDVGAVCASLAESSGRSEAEVLAAYLAASDLDLDLEIAMNELRLTRLVHCCWSLPWLVREHRSGGSAAPYLAGTFACVTQDTSHLDALL